MNSRSAFGLSRDSTGKQADRGRARRVVQDLRGADRRAALAGGQQARAQVREEERVDEFALAARDLGDEGDRQAVGGEPALQVGDAGHGLLVAQAVHQRPAAKSGQGRGRLLAPLLQGGEAGLEGAVIHGGRRVAHRWHEAQKNEARPPWRPARTARPQAGHGSPSRP